LPKAGIGGGKDKGFRAISKLGLLRFGRGFLARNWRNSQYRLGFTGLGLGFEGFLRLAGI
jgi:hypothetical protein